MSYEALVCKVVTRPHPNADKLQLGIVGGHQVIVGKDVQDGDLGIFFPCDGQLSHDFCMQNKLYRKHPNTGEPMGGLFEENRRVRTVRLRGCESEGFWIPVNSIEYTGKKVKEGNTFSKLGDHEICEKYYSAKTREYIRSTQAKGKKPNVKDRVRIPDFKKHFDTQQLRHHISGIPVGSLCILTEKCHGTSQRSGNLRHFKKLSLWKRMWYRLTGKPTYDWKHVMGTRNVTRPENDKGYRADFHKKLSLRKGETLYYEVVGFEDSGKSIMPSHSVEDKELKKKYGTKMVYRYGCVENECKVFVYRITMTNEDGVAIEMPWYAIKARCKELGLETVPELAQVFFSSPEDLLAVIKPLSDGPSTLDPSHIREGVCVKVEHELMEKTFKYKGFTFCDLEGIAKNDDSYVDPEEVS